MRRLHRYRGILPDDGCPLPHIPAPDRAMGHVGIFAGELLGNLRGIALEEQYRTVYRMGQGAAEDEFAALDGLPRLFQVRFPKLARRET